MSSPFRRSLPARPNLEQQKRQAKELLEAFTAGDAEAQARLRRSSRTSSPSHSPTRSSCSRGNTASPTGRRSRSTSSLRRRIEPPSSSACTRHFAGGMPVRCDACSRSTPSCARGSTIRSSASIPRRSSRTPTILRSWRCCSNSAPTRTGGANGGRAGFMRCTARPAQQRSA